MTDFPCSRERQNCDPVGSFLVIASYPKSAASGPEPVTKHPFRGSQVESCHAIAGIHHGLRISLAGSVHINRQHRRETADILSGNLKSVEMMASGLVTLSQPYLHRMSHRVAFPAHAPSDEIQSGRTLLPVRDPDTVTVRIPLHNDTVTCPTISSPSPVQLP